MPRRTDIKSILLIGSGPIIIGQACEFDYSGVQAIKALKEEGFRVILVNSNPATIMTDPELADRTYIEPITPEFVAKVIEIERPDAVLPTMGGQTALNTALALDEMGVLKKFNCELIGANVASIEMAEDRALFRTAMDEIGLESARSGIARTLQDAREIREQIGFPMILRPSRTLGGSGGGIVRTPEEFEPMVSRALATSPVSEVLIEESLIGWKEIELEVMRDLKDNVVIVCTIENIDPMGVHTGDSITVAPIQTLTDKEYQLLRDAAIKVMRKIGVNTGGSNVQFCMDPKTGRIIVIEMNPRVSRSSALASKATGFPIAKIAAKLAVGYTLDEIPNDITKETPACFEPSIDYVVVKIPRFDFQKFPLADSTLGTQMKSVGEAMSFGRTFQEALQKALYSMEISSAGFDHAKRVNGLSAQEVLEACARPHPQRLWLVAEALRMGVSVEDLYEASGIDPWFLTEINCIVKEEQGLVRLRESGETQLAAGHLRELKEAGFSDARLAQLLELPESEIRQQRIRHHIKPIYKAVDTCAAEFVAHTPYLYSSYDSEAEAPATARRKIIILGSGPNRIGQGIEFDYCCVHAVMALKEDGYEAIMVNCNPETVSTDYDISDRLYFEPLTFESVLAIVERERPDGVIVQFGGQTPLKLAERLKAAGVPIIGTSVDSIDCAEDRERFGALVTRLGLLQPESRIARSFEEAVKGAGELGYPLMIRPSFVLGGRAMRVLYSDEDLEGYLREGIEVTESKPLLLDRFLDNAIEVDVDAVSDGQEVLIAGVMEHIERAGVHSGDSSCALPPQSLSPKMIQELKRQAALLAAELKVIGLMNVQFAVSSDQKIYVLEANPRASRTVPFVSKATGVPWAKIAARLMAGKTIRELGVKECEPVGFVAVKASVFPFSKFAGVDTLLGPEMKSTGEVMGISPNFASSFAKSQIAAGVRLPQTGTVFLSVRDADKGALPPLAERLLASGFNLIGTTGTAAYLNERGLACKQINRVSEGSPHIVDLLGQGEIVLVINTPDGAGPYLDSRAIRLVANELKVPTYTTLAAADALSMALLAASQSSEVNAQAIQEYHRALGN